MRVSIKCIGKLDELLSEYGAIDANVVVKQIVTKTKVELINIGEINKASHHMQLLLNEEGEPLSDCKTAAILGAKFRIVYFGIENTVGNPLYMLFIKLNNRWKGIYIGELSSVGTFLYKNNKGAFNFDNCKQYFKEEYNSTGLIGQGRLEIEAFLTNPNDIEFDSSGKPKRTKDSKFTPLTKQQKTRAAKAGLKLPSDPIKAKEIFNNYLEEERQRKLKEEEEQAKSVSRSLEDKNDIANIGNAIAKLKAEESIDAKASVEKSEAEEVEESNENGLYEASTLEVNKQMNSTGVANIEDAKAAEIKTDEQEVEEIELDIEEVDSNSSDTLAEAEENIANKETSKQIKVEEANEKVNTAKADANIANADEANAEDEEEIHEIELLITNRNVKDSSDLIKFCTELLNDTMEECKVGLDTPVKYSAYICSLMILINKHYKDEERYCLKSTDGTKCIINTGLLDKYGCEIYIIDTTMNTFGIQQKKLIRYINKARAVEIGFDKQKLDNLPEKIKIGVDSDNSLCNAKFSDFDLDDPYHICHIVEERLYRFPNKYTTLSPEDLWGIVKKSAERSIKIAISDMNYASIMCDIKKGQVEYLIPLYLNEDRAEAAPLVGILRKENGFWIMSTILTNEAAYAYARLIGTPYQPWWKENNN